MKRTHLYTKPFLLNNGSDVTKYGGVNECAKEENENTENLFLLCIGRNISESNGGQGGHHEVERRNITWK